MRTGLAARVPVAIALDRDCALGHPVGQRGIQMASDRAREGQRLASAIRAAGLAVLALTLFAGATGLWLGWGQGLTVDAVEETIRSWGMWGVLASIGWFSAFALENASYVRAVGQIELIFTFIASIFFFRESTNRKEVLGILLVAAGIIMLVLTR